ncbi:MAG: hypothetical protein ACW96X_04995 [Promethearchaeota archaeon]|jgi:hypothetical protein
MGGKLICSVCGRVQEVPSCCDKSMIMKEGYLLCCCSEECGHQPIPECCGKKMVYT